VSVDRFSGVFHEPRNCEKMEIDNDRGIGDRSFHFWHHAAALHSAYRVRRLPSRRKTRNEARTKGVQLLLLLVHSHMHDRPGHIRYITRTSFKTVPILHGSEDVIQAVWIYYYYYYILECFFIEKAQ